jgi:hypothetical protein
VASAEALAAAREELLIAEGSDWCWWYGDDHHSDHDREFDDLFRRHVRNIYRALGLPIPEDLFVTNITTMPPKVTVLPPTGPTAPRVDGRESSYFEWLGAGEVTPSATAGAMHQVASVGQRIAGVRFGFGADDLCLQIATTEPLAESLAQGGELAVAFLEPAGTRIAINSAHRDGTVFRRTATGPGWKPRGGTSRPRWTRWRSCGFRSSGSGSRARRAVVRGHAAAIVTGRRRVHADRGNDGARTGHRRQTWRA